MCDELGVKGVAMPTRATTRAWLALRADIVKLLEIKKTKQKQVRGRAREARPLGGRHARPKVSTAFSSRDAFWTRGCPIVGTAVVLDVVRATP